MLTITPTTTYEEYEIVLICPYCSVERILGTVQAATRGKAKEQAEGRWPDARSEEMVVRHLIKEGGRVVPSTSMRPPIVPL